MKAISRLNSGAVSDHFDYLHTCEEVVDTRFHLRKMYELAQGNVVEIGADIGNSTTAFLKGVIEKGGHLYSIDINPGCACLYEGHSQWTFIHGSSYDDAPRILQALPNEVDLLYVDGDHSYKAAKSDLENYGNIVRPGGFIMIHDVLHPQFPGVHQAFREYTRGSKSIQGSADIEGSWGLGIIQV